MRILFLNMAMLATFATRGLAAPSGDLAVVNNATELWEQNCPGGGPGARCPWGYFCVSPLISVYFQ